MVSCREATTYVDRYLRAPLYSFTEAGPVVYRVVRSFVHKLAFRFASGSVAEPGAHFHGLRPFSYGCLSGSQLPPRVASGRYLYFSAPTITHAATLPRGLSRG